MMRYLVLRKLLLVLFLAALPTEAFGTPSAREVIDTEELDRLIDYSGQYGQFPLNAIVPPPLEFSQLKIYVYDLPEHLRLERVHEGSGVQYSLGAMFYDRLMGDRRITKNITEAHIFIVPIDLQRFKVESTQFPTPGEANQYVCDRVTEVMRYVEPIRQKLEVWETRLWLNSTGRFSETYGTPILTALPPMFAKHASTLFGSGPSQNKNDSSFKARKNNATKQNFEQLRQTGLSLDILHIARTRRRRLRTLGALSHLVPVARVSASILHEWGKACLSTFEWFRRSLQWITIESPYRIEFATQEARLDISGAEARTARAAVVLGMPSHHTVPYPCGIRFETNEDHMHLVRFQRNAVRDFLVAQVLGSHNRPGSRLRTILKEECAKLGAPLCANDYMSARKAIARPNRRESAHSPTNFAARLAHGAPHLPLYATAVFCLQPFGTTPTRNAIFQCLLAGGVPVLFEPFLIEALRPLFDLVDRVDRPRYEAQEAAQLHSTANNVQEEEDLLLEQHREPYHPTSAAAADNWCVLIPLKAAIANPSVEIYERLASMPVAKLAYLRHIIAIAAPRFQYSLNFSNMNTSASSDAYDYAVHRAFSFYKINLQKVNAEFAASAKKSNANNDQLFPVSASSAASFETSMLARWRAEHA